MRVHCREPVHSDLREGSDKRHLDEAEVWFFGRARGSWNWLWLLSSFAIDEGGDSKDDAEERDGHDTAKDEDNVNMEFVGCLGPAEFGDDLRSLSAELTQKRVSLEGGEAQKGDDQTGGSEKQVPSVHGSPPERDEHLLYIDNITIIYCQFFYALSFIIS